MSAIRNGRCGMLMVVALLRLLTGAPSWAADAKAEKPPERYVLDYPLASQCCPPIRSTFAEVNETIGVVRGHRFRQQSNGGFGLPIIEKAGDQHLIHTGADLGWFQVGEPVFAIANGVVRISTGPRLTDEPDLRDTKSMMWGNLVVIEHRFAGDTYFTSVYGHLATDRRVKQGDVVAAGQMIGTIGRKHLRINGGYNPHVHFGIRQGRNAEIGAKCLSLRREGRVLEFTLAKLGEEQIELTIPDGVRLPLRASAAGEDFEITAKDDRGVMPAKWLWTWQRGDFPIVGYDLSTKGWEDPVAFLRQHTADTNPAPLRAGRPNSLSRYSGRAGVRVFPRLKRPLTPTLSPEYRGEGAFRQPLSEDCRGIDSSRCCQQSGSSRSARNLCLNSRD